MRIIQLLPSIAYGDAVGNDAIALLKILEQLGVETAIYAGDIDPRLTEKKLFYAHNLPKLEAEDILIYHMAIGCYLTYEIEKHNCRKIMIYHNITPAKYFKNYSQKSYLLTLKGLEEVRYLADKFDYVLAVSEFNKQDLISYGYTCPIDVLPIQIPFDDYKRAPDKNVFSRYEDNKVNLLFVGRVAPNKKIQDVIKTFYHYQKCYNPNSRLFLVGSWGGMDTYKERLDEYIKNLGLVDVIFPGHIKFNAILAYYQLADAFVCMSEHEGFCVPLVEAMFFDLPIVAHASAAIPDTLGGSGILLHDRNPLLAAGMIDRIVKTPSLKNCIIQGQRHRIEDFSYEKVRSLFLQYLNAFIRASCSGTPGIL